MWTNKSETDPLLPNYSQSPEINSHQHRSSEIQSYNSVPFGKQADDDWTHSVSAASIEDESEVADHDSSSSMETVMSKVFRMVFILIAVGCFFAMITAYLGEHQSSSKPWYPGPPSSPEQRARRVLASTPLIDGHNDLAIFLRERYRNDISNSTFRHDFETGAMPLNVDLPRLKTGQAGGAFWSAFVLCPVNASYDMSDENYATAVSHTLEQIDLLKRLQLQYTSRFSSASAGREKMIDDWKETKSLFGPISIEGLHQVSPSAPMSMLRLYRDFGVRMATLTWNCHNPFADAALVWNDFTKPPSVVNKVFRPDQGALTKRGKEVLREMNRLGMIIDISHTSYWTQKAVLSSTEDGERLTRAPVVFSHSSAYSLCPHPRNVRDDILDLVKATNSLVMVNFSPDFISCVHVDRKDNEEQPHFSIPEFYEQNNTLHQVARHIMYIGQRIGYDHVGLGSDFDGMGEKTPRGLEGVDKFPDLVTELLKMGVTDEQASKVIGGNVLRVWKAVDETSARMIAEGIQPGLDDADGF